ncbi:MAG: hypothetical protein K1Y01_00595 [Vicinamibacteria bacterium]|nr:hypothetical protein [Vicinamibacteria bacterium]
MSLPRRPGVEEMMYPTVAASSTGGLVLALHASGKDGTSAIHVARAKGEGWEWLGSPLLSSQQPFTHANDVSVAFTEGADPLVAWSEERNVSLAGLFVARWDGASWKRLGVLHPLGRDYYLSPTVTVDASRTVWLGWKEAGPDGLRVARWSGTAWIDVGRDSLRALVGQQGEVFHPSFVVDGKGQPWALWIDAKERRKSSVRLGRWDGNRWNAVPAPHPPGGTNESAASAAIMIRDGVPVVAWSQLDDTENNRLFVAEWGGSDEWRMRIAGLHLAEGVSDVGDVRLTAGDGNSFFVSWDEAGKDKRRTRLVQAYACAPGESPAAPPRSAVERDGWPTTVDQAARQIVDEMSPEDKVRVRGTAKEQLIQFHHGWGTGIRNSLGLWRGNEKLLESCGKGKRAHPDECSMTIIEAVWTLLQAQPQ